VLGGDDERRLEMHGSPPDERRLEIHEIHIAPHSCWRPTTNEEQCWVTGYKSEEQCLSTRVEGG
jgi:hypothetical protein